MIRRRLVHRQPQKTPHRQRVRAPGDPAFRVDPFKVANQQQPEVDPAPGSAVPSPARRTSRTGLRQIDRSRRRPAAHSAACRRDAPVPLPTRCAPTRSPLASPAACACPLPCAHCRNKACDPFIYLVPTHPDLHHRLLGLLYLIDQDPRAHLRLFKRKPTLHCRCPCSLRRCSTQRILKFVGIVCAQSEELDFERRSFRFLAKDLHETRVAAGIMKLPRRPSPSGSRIEVAKHNSLPSRRGGSSYGFSQSWRTAPSGQRAKGQHGPRFRRLPQNSTDSRDLWARNALRRRR